MPRSVNHVASRARRKKILKLTRGYYGARKNVWTVAKNTWEKGLTYAFIDRRKKKRNFRALWIQRINAAARLEGLSYSQLIGALHKATCKSIVRFLQISLLTIQKLSKLSLQKLSNCFHNSIRRPHRQFVYEVFFCICMCQCYRVMLFCMYIMFVALGCNGCDVI